jgi:hypothetical protein
VKTALLILTFLLSITAYSAGVGNNFIGRSNALHVFKYDTNTIMLRRFKAFSKRFFRAIKSNETIFIKNHAIFPITHSSFINMDSSLRGNRNISQQVFFKHLRKLFPEGLINRIDKEGEFEISATKNEQTEYSISIYDSSGEMEFDFTWSFIERQNEFYFVRFRAEPG